MSKVQVTPETEQRVIEAILRDHRCYYALMLTPRHFEDARHRKAFTAVADLVEHGVEPTVEAMAEKIGASAAVGYSPVTAANVEHYAARLRERKRCRDLAALFADAAARLDHEESSGVVDFAASELVKIQDDTPTGLVKVSELTVETLNRIEAAMKRGGELPGVGSGYRGLDAMTGGFRQAEMCVIAARTSIGKTAFALNVAENMARSGAHVAFFSLEMSREEVMDRFAASVSGLSHQRIRKGQISTNGDFTRLDDAMRRLHSEPLWICDEPNAGFPDIRNMSRMFCAQGGQVIFIDYLTLIKYGDARTPRPERVGALSKELKSLSRELRVPVIVMSQLNRESEESRPTLATIRQSGEIEEDADMILLMHRPREGDETEVNVAKHRNGPTGTVTFRFDKDLLRFNEVDRRYE